MAHLGLGLGFKMLPSLSEGDERVSLGDILTQRDAPLTDPELWAVCVECCVAIQGVSHSPEMFQTLCISPDTLAFDSTGAVCFLDIIADPEPMYSPPEYESVGNSFKSHLYSLGMTLLYAVEYNVSVSSHHRQHNLALNGMLTEMTRDDYDERASLDDVISVCAVNLKGATPSQICRCLVMEAKLDTSGEEERDASPSPRRIPETSRSSLTFTERLHSRASPSGSSSPLDHPPIPRGASHQRGSSPVPFSLHLPPHKPRASTPELSDVDIADSAVKPDETASSLAGLELDFISDLSLEHALLEPAHELHVETSGIEEKNQKHQLCNTRDDDDDDERCSEEAQWEENNEVAGAQLPTCDVISVIEQSDCSTEGVPHNQGAAKLNNNTQTAGAAPLGTNPSHALHRLKRSSHQRVSEPGRSETCSVNSLHIAGAGPVCSSYNKEDRRTVPFASVFGRHEAVKDGSSAEKPSGLDEDSDAGDSDSEGLSAGTPASDVTGLRGSPEDLVSGSEDYYYYEDWELDPSEQGGVRGGETEMQGKGMDKGGEDRHPVHPVHPRHMRHAVQVHNVQEILQKLGCGLHENELWALCRECVLALHRQRHDLPAYVSLETVAVQVSGQVTFRPVPEDKELEVVYLAPELQQYGVVTEKTCLFGLAAMLWSAADYKMPANQEPVLSERFENLLMSMTQDNSKRRPSTNDVLQVCNSIQKRSDGSSRLICRGLAGDARKAAEFGRENTLVRDFLNEEIHQQAQCHKAQLVNSIGVAKLQSRLKPVSERSIGASKTALPNPHEQLMSEIKDSNISLRKSSEPTPLTVQEVFQLNPGLKKVLKRVTVKAKMQHRSPTELSSVKLQGKSAFSSVPQTESPPKDSADSVQQPEVPQAYKSTATHFSPIVLTGDSKVKSPASTKVKSPASTKVKSPAASKVKPKSVVLTAEERERQTVEKIKELKKNLARSRLPLSLAQDLENDVRKETESEKQTSPAASSGSKGSTPPACGTSPKAATVVVQAPLTNSGSHVTESPSQPHVAKSPGHYNGGVPQTEHDLENGTQGHDLEFSAQGQVPLLHQQQPYLPNSQPSPHSGGQYFTPPGYPPNMGHGQFVNVGQGHIVQQPVAQQLPTFSYPMMQPVPMAGPMFPFQIQFQQDPRTGLFQIVPVAVPAQPGISPVYGSQFSGDAASIHSSTPSHMEHQNISLSSNGSHSPTYGSQFETDMTDKPKFAKNAGKNTNSKSQKYRSRSGSIDKTKNRPPLSESTKEPQPRSKSGDRSHDTGSSRGTKEGRHQRSRTLGSEDIEHDLSQLVQNGDGSYTYEDLPKLSRLSSADLWERIEHVSKPKPKTPRSVKQKDLNSRLKRAKSIGSSMDYNQRSGNPELRSYNIYDDTDPQESGAPSRDNPLLSKSQPSLDAVLSEEDTVGTKTKRSSRPRRKTDVVSLDYIPSPPPSPSLSKDSGLGSWNFKRSGDPALMDKLLNSETIRNQQKLSKVIKLLRDEFAFDGYMENGIEDLVIAEYIMSLGSLTYRTFSGAVTEKYCDLYWADDLLSGLYEAVNGCKPEVNKRHTPKTTASASKSPGHSSSTKHTPVVGTQSTTDHPPSQGEDTALQAQRSPTQDSENVWEAETTESFLPILRDCYDQSAFRPIKMPVTSNPTSAVATESKPMFKPKPRKPADYTDTSESCSTDSDVAEPRWRHRKKRSDHVRSSSLHNIVYEPSMMDPSLSKAKSQGELDRAACDECGKSPTPAENSTSKGSRVILVKSSESEYDLESTVSSTNTLSSHATPVSDPFSVDPLRLSNRDRQKSQSSYHIFRPSESTPTSPGVRSPGPGVPSQSSHMVNGSGGKLAAKSESHLFQLPTATRGQAVVLSGAPLRVLQRGYVVYYWAEMQLIMQQDMRAFAAQVDARTLSKVESKMADLDQQMMVEYRNKKKTQRYYRKLVAATKIGKVTTEHKAQLTQVSRQLQESKSTLEFLDSAKKHMEMLHAEMYSVDPNLLHSLAMLPSNQPLQLSPSNLNPLLQYQIKKSEKGQVMGEVLQAGTPQGLMSHLYAQSSLSEGYIHQFFYCYRYLVAPCDLLSFLGDKYTAACLSLQVKVRSEVTDLATKVMTRSLDLLQVWLEGYYTLDFKHNPQLWQDVQAFIREQVVPTDENSAEVLQELVELCEEGRHDDLVYREYALMSKGQGRQDNSGPPKKKNMKKGTKGYKAALCDIEDLEWESFKAAFHLSAKPIKLQQQQEVAARSKVRSGREPANEVQSFQVIPGRSDAFTLADHSPTVLAEQLTLMDQELFRQSHPLHFLNSKVQGVGVGLATPIMNKSQSISTLNSAWDGNQSSNLFVGHHMVDDIIERLIEHAQSIAFWVAAEILSCTSTKTQVVVLSRFIQTAKACQEVRNYASCVAIMDGLENIIIRQLPAWKSLSSKCTSTVDELQALKVLLSTDSQCLLKDQSRGHQATVPCILLLLLQVQQLEIGGFTLANGMYKWSKMRSITMLTDQLRIFHQYSYSFPADSHLQASIRQRIREFGQRDLASLASQNDGNFRKASSGNKLQGAFKRMRVKLHGKTEV